METVNGDFRPVIEWWCVEMSLEREVGGVEEEDCWIFDQIVRCCSCGYVCLTGGF